MQSSNGSFQCQICGKMILFSQQSSHRAKCKKPSIDINKNQSKNNDKNNNFECREGIEVILLNGFNSPFDIRSDMSDGSFFLGLIEDINRGSEDTINDSGINNARNISSNYYFGPSSLNDNNINSNPLTIFNSLLPVNRMILDNIHATIISEGNVLLDSNCIICLGQYQIGQKLIILPCNHKYHEQCIKTWINQKNMCPLCCRQLSINDIL